MRRGRRKKRPWPMQHGYTGQESDNYFPGYQGMDVLLPAKVLREAIQREDRRAELRYLIDE